MDGGPKSCLDSLQAKRHILTCCHVVKPGLAVVLAFGCIVVTYHRPKIFPSRQRYDLLRMVACCLLGLVRLPVDVQVLIVIFGQPQTHARVHVAQVTGHKPRPVRRDWERLNDVLVRVPIRIDHAVRSAPARFPQPSTHKPREAL